MSASTSVESEMSTDLNEKEQVKYSKFGQMSKSVSNFGMAGWICCWFDSSFVQTENKILQVILNFF